MILSGYYGLGAFVPGHLIKSFPNETSEPNHFTDWKILINILMIVGGTF